MPTRESPLTVRAVTESGGRTLQATIATENPAAVLDGRGSIVDEVLLVSGCEVSPHVPLLLDHQRSVREQVGSVDAIQAVGGALHGSLRFADGHAAADDAWALYSQRHGRAVSVGYRLLEYADLRPGETRSIAGRSFTAPQDRVLRVTSRWRLHEVSLVPIGADPAALTRSHFRLQTRSVSTMPYVPRTYPKGRGDERTRAAADRILDATAPVVRATCSTRWPEFCAIALRSLNADVPENDADCIRAGLSHIEVATALDGLVATAIVKGAANEVDNAAGLYQVVDLPSFKPASALSTDVGARLEKLPRGGTAKQIAFGLKGQTWRMSRYAAQATLAEEDLFDGEPIGLQLVAMEELGRAATRAKLDLFFALLLSNPTLAANSTALFHTDHANLGAAALADTALAAAIAAVGGQTREDIDGGAIHDNAEPRVLLVPPALAAKARKLVRDLQLGDGHDIEVRAESRLGTAGVVDPDGGTVYTGSDTNWLLAALAASTPSILMGGLGGSLEPKIRSYSLSEGAWGMGYDVLLDVGATAIDHRGLYWSAGTS